MRRIVVLEHTRTAGLAGFTEVLESRRSIAPFERLDVPAGAELPDDLDDVAGLVVMGGTMSAVDPAAHAWMPPELELLRRAVDEGVPVFGVCLGAQLLGAGLGGRVVRREVPEVGYLPLSRTPEGRDDPLLAGWPDGAAALMVHEDEVGTLPAGAVPLLSGSDGVPAWRAGSAWAVQFHPEVTADQVEVWLKGRALAELLATSGIDTAGLLEESRRRTRFTLGQGRALIGRFLDGPVRQRATSRPGARTAEG